MENHHGRGACCHGKRIKKFIHNLFQRQLLNDVPEIPKKFLIKEVSKYVLVDSFGKIPRKSDHHDKEYKTKTLKS